MSEDWTKLIQELGKDFVANAAGRKVKTDDISTLFALMAILEQLKRIADALEDNK